MTRFWLRFQLFWAWLTASTDLVSQEADLLLCARLLIRDCECCGARRETDRLHLADCPITAINLDTSRHLAYALGSGIALDDWCRAFCLSQGLKPDPENLAQMTAWLDRCVKWANGPKSRMAA